MTCRSNIGRSRNPADVSVTAGTAQEKTIRIDRRDMFGPCIDGDTIKSGFGKKPGINPAH